MQKEYARFVEETETGRESFFDDDSAFSPAEFFADAAEAFFTVPRDFQKGYPELYRELARYFG